MHGGKMSYSLKGEPARQLCLIKSSKCTVFKISINTAVPDTLVIALHTLPCHYHVGVTNVLRIVHLPDNWVLWCSISTDRSVHIYCMISSYDQIQQQQLHWEYLLSSVKTLHWCLLETILEISESMERWRFATVYSVLLYPDAPCCSWH